MRRKVLNQQQTYRLIREQLETKIEEQKIKEAQAAFRRSILQNFAEELRGEATDLSQLEEGLMSSLFDKAKSFVGGSGKQQAAFTNAVAKATSKETQIFFQKLQKIAPGFPNTKGEEKFLAGLALLKGVYGSMAQQAAAAETQVQRIASAAVATDIANYAQEAVGDVSRTFKYFKEETIDGQGVVTISEINIGKTIKKVQSGDLSPMDAITKLEKAIDSPLSGKGREQTMDAAIDQIKDIGREMYGPEAHAAMDAARDQLAAADNPIAKKAAKKAVKKATQAFKDPIDNADGEFPSPDPGDYEGQGSPWEMDPEFDPDATPGLDSGIGIDAGDMGDLGDAAEAAGGGAEMISVLGMPIAKSLAYGIGGGVAAVAIGALAYKAYKVLKAKKEKGDSREGMLKSTAQEMSPVEAAPGAPEAAPEEGGDAVGTAPEGGDAGGAPGEEGGSEVINVFKGKGGAGMQSQLAKAGIQGKDMSRILKGLRADLSAAGFQVMEEAKRRVIGLDSTLGAIEQIGDPGQKEAAKKAVVGMLRQHGVKLDPKSSMALKPSAGPEQGGETAPDAPDVQPERPSQKGPAAGGKPALDPAQAQRAAASNAAQAQRGGPAAQAAPPGGEEDEEEKKRKSKFGFGPGSMKDASSGVTMEEEGGYRNSPTLAQISWNC